MPTEAEINDTFANFGAELQHAIPSLLQMLEVQVIEPLLRNIDESDHMWTHELAQRGWRFNREPSRLAYRGLGRQPQELSVFDRSLPPPLCNEPRAVELWAQRQKMEICLLHPLFEPTQRGYVMERLREWVQLGIARSMKYQTQSSNAMPTDLHILENLLFKLLSLHFDFVNCFLCRGQVPPQVKIMGQPAVAYLRQVVDENVFPRMAPHYEVVTQQKVWKFKSGSPTNVLEAFVVMMHILKRRSQSYQAFPESVRQALEVAATGLSNASRPMQWF